MRTIPVLDHGHVGVVSSTGNDRTVALAARASLAQMGEELPEERVAGIVRFTMDNHHGSVYEHCTVTFEVRAPWYIFRQWHRHRTQSYNEQSARYSLIQEQFHVPEVVRQQVAGSKPGAYSYEPMAEPANGEARALIEAACHDAFAAYQDLLDLGVAKEQARAVLPVATYSQMWASASLRNWMRFLGLRNSEHAQDEIAQYAQVIEDELTALYPISMTRFIENGRVAP